MPSRIEQPQSTWRTHSVSILGLVVKLLKTAKVVKVALAGMALAGWSLLFSWQFACVLIAVVVFHEYGHLRAMKKFSLPTKGMYLIPFVGGVAIGAKPQNHWQDVYISMMGPVYGLVMTVVFFFVYLLTDSHFAGLVATFSALINLFNLLPVYPLDGGRVLKSMALSIDRRFGLLFLLAFSVICFFVSSYLGLMFLSFFVFLGALDLAFSWRHATRETQLPLTGYGVVFSGIWYISLIVLFLGVIYFISSRQVPGSEVVVRILQS